jgi:hypothetical protein
MSYINQVSSLGPKVWYRFNETAGTPANFGSLSTTATFINLLLNEQTSVDGRCVYFSGSSAISLPSYPAFSLFDDKSFTIETWIKASATDVAAYADPQLFSIIGPSNINTVITLALGGSFYGNAGKVLLRTANGVGTSSNIVSATRVDDDQWHHIVATINTTSIKIYIDGALSASGTPSFGNAFNFDVQENKKTIGSGFRGRLDEFAIYDRELTASDIATNYTAGAVVEIAAGSFGTATSLMVQPTVVASFNPAAQAPMTASAASGDHYNSTVTFPTLLNTYMSTLTLQSWFKFDKNRVLTNYGTEPTRASYWGSGVSNTPTGGVQGSGELRYTTAGGLQAYIDPATAATTGEVALLNDEDFTIGFWTKKLTKEVTYIMSAYNTASTQSVNFQYNTDGGISFVITHSGTNHTIASSTDITDGEWHFVVGKLSSNTMQLWVDGTSIGTTAMTHNLALDYINIGSNASTDTTSLSNLFITTSAAIGTTEIANMWDYGTPSVLQAAAHMPEASAKFNSAFNDYIQSKNPVIDYRLDESAGSPRNYGTASLELVPYLSPQGFIQGELGLNTRAFKFTSRDQTTRGSYSFAAGTFSTDDICTIGVLFKNANATNQQGIVGFGGRSTAADGNGFSLQMLATSGYLRILAGNANGTVTSYTGTTNYADNKWHLATIVKSASTVKLYIDGKEHITGSNSTAMTDNGEFIIGGVAGIVAAAASRDTLIDEVFVTNTAFTAQETFEAWQSLRLEMETTATALMVQPDSLTLGTGNIYTAAVATASGLLVMPTETQEIAPTIEHMEAFGVFQHPNYGGNVVIDVNYGTTAFAADAEFHIPGFSVGEINSAVHMQGSALMVHPVSIAGGTISVNPFIALNATLVDPGIVTIKGALVKAQTLNANAFAPLPPQYFTIADDLWYQRLVAIDQKDSVGASSIVFFNTSDNFYVPSTGAVDPIPGSGWTVRAPSGARAVNTVTNPLPAINGGYFDAQNRKAVNFRNIEITTGAPSPFGAGDRDFTFEAMIRTTKSNQVLFVGENENIYNFQRTGIVLRNGKLALTYSKDGRAGNVSANDQELAFIGNKNIADGEWHHIIIQNRQTGTDRSAPRLQFWIDGQLDIQRYGNEMYVINRIGYNSSEANSYSDFTISAFGLGLSAMVEENEINLNYLAAINVVPVKAGVSTATATATPNTKGRGNRGRALMLYFWPTVNATSGIYRPLPDRSFLGTGFGNNFHGFDQGSYGSDPDTFYQLTTYINRGASQFYDWDIWPVPVVKLFDGDRWVGESHPILKDGITKSGTDKGTVYVDPVTDNERYLNLMTDLKDLSQFDMICFRNYPDQSGEQDQYGVNAKGVVDDYFNLLDKNLFADFLKSLRDAVDTGISLFITNPQLAVDMGFIDTYHEVSDLTNSGNEGGSDPFVPIKLDNPYGDGSEIYSYSQAYKTDSGDEFLDAYRNNYHQVVNTLADLTDDDGFIWTDEIKYQADQSEFGELDRWWSHIEYKDSLQVGDRFLISTTPTFNQTYFATPLDAVRAGKVITKFADTYRFGAVERVNPYRNYATSIAVEPGTVVAGKQIGAKVFISFTDVVGKQQIGRVIGDGLGDSIEQKTVSLDTSYWISYAYSIGAITTDERDQYLADANGQIVDWTTLTSRDTKYWTSDGSSIIGSSSAYGDNDEILTDTAAAVQNKKTSPRTRRRKGRAKRVGATGLIPNFQVIWGYLSPRLSVPVPSINTRGLWWLSERLEYADGVPLRPEAFEADGFMKQPVITGFKTATVAAQAAVAVGAMIETNLRSAGTSISVLPLTATAFFVEKGTFVPAEPATAVARTPQDIRTTTFESDQVVLYLVHVDPILYLREDVIK